MSRACQAGNWIANVEYQQRLPENDPYSIQKNGNEHIFSGRSLATTSCHFIVGNILRVLLLGILITATLQSSAHGQGQTAYGLIKADATPNVKANLDRFGDVESYYIRAYGIYYSYHINSSTLQYSHHGIIGYSDNIESSGYSSEYNKVSNFLKWARNYEFIIGSWDFSPLSGRTNILGSYKYQNATYYGVNLTPGFTGPKPPKTSLIHPLGETFTGCEIAPTFEWNEVDEATWYLLWFELDGKKYAEKWVQGDLYDWEADFNFKSGSYRWWVATWNSNGYGPWSSPGSFTVSKIEAPDPVLPPGNATFVTGDQPTFTWTSVPCAEQYQVYLVRDTPPLMVGEITWNQWFVDKTSAPLPQPLQYGNYKWYVRAWSKAKGYSDWSVTFRFTVEKKLPPTPTHLTPLQEQQFHTGDPIIFSWTQETHATKYQYWFAKWEETEFQDYWSYHSSPIIYSTSSTTFSNLGHGRYKWYVRAGNAEGWSEWSPVGFFTINKRVPLAPQVDESENSDSFTLGTSTPTLKWKSVAGATWYQIWVYQNGKLVKKQWQEGGINVTITIEFGKGDYEWWVQAWNPDGTSQWTRGGEFAVAGEEPGKVVTTAPALGSRIDRASQSIATLRWQQAPYATWYRVFVNRDGAKILDTWIKGGAVTSYELPLHRAGNYEFWVQAWNKQGTGAWSNSRKFTAFNSSVTLEEVEVFSPSFNSAVTNPVTVSWYPDESATWYLVKVYWEYDSNDRRLVSSHWVAAPSSSANVSTTIPKTLQVEAGFAFEGYSVEVLAWADGEYGPLHFNWNYFLLYP